MDPVALNLTRLLAGGTPGGATPDDPLLRLGATLSARVLSRDGRQYRLDLGTRQVNVWSEARLALEGSVRVRVVEAARLGRLATVAPFEVGADDAAPGRRAAAPDLRPSKQDARVGSGSLGLPSPSTSETRPTSLRATPAGVATEQTAPALSSRATDATAATSSSARTNARATNAAAPIGRQQPAVALTHSTLGTPAREVAPNPLIERATSAPTSPARRLRALAAALARSSASAQAPSDGTRPTLLAELARVVREHSSMPADGRALCQRVLHAGLLFEAALLSGAKQPSGWSADSDLKAMLLRAAGSGDDALNTVLRRALDGLVAEQWLTAARADAGESPSIAFALPDGAGLTNAWIVRERDARDGDRGEHTPVRVSVGVRFSKIGTVRLDIMSLEGQQTLRLTFAERRGFDAVENQHSELERILRSNVGDVRLELKLDAAEAEAPPTRDSGAGDDRGRLLDRSA